VHTAQVCDVLDAAGYQRIVIETVGVGQSELEIAQTADTTAVVLVPESGDGIQAMKAGLMEIGDLFVVNKADRDGADRGAHAIRSALELRAALSDWNPPVLMTVATQATGVAEVVDAFEAHREHLERHGGLLQRRRHRLEQRLRELLRDRLWLHFQDRIPSERWRRAIEDLVARKGTPRRIAERLERSASG
jgi:LAO/AO transport system kinase